MAPTSKSRPTTTTTSPPAAKPANWLSEHDAFVRHHARNGEDSTSVLILFETEYPDVEGVTKAWIDERMRTELELDTDTGTRPAKKGKR